MSQGANVRSIDAVRHFRAVLRTFLQEARESLSTFNLEVNRTLTWLHEDLPEQWQNEIRRSDEAIHQAKLDLQRCRQTPLPGGGTPSCMEEKKMLERAKQRRQYADDKLAATRRWGYTAGREAAEYSGRAGQLGNVLDADVPRALALLDRVLTSLEAYRAVRFTGETARELAAETTAAPVSRPEPVDSTPESAARAAEPAPADDPPSNAITPPKEQP